MPQALPPIPDEKNLTKGFAPPAQSTKISPVAVPAEAPLPVYTPPKAPNAVTQGVAVALSAMAGVPGGQELLNDAITKTMTDYRQRQAMFESDTRRMLEVRWKARMDERANAQALNVDISKANQTAQGNDAVLTENARHDFALEHLQTIEAQIARIQAERNMGLMDAQQAESEMQTLKTKAEAVQTWMQSIRESLGVSRKRSEVGGASGGGGADGGGDASMGKLGYQVPDNTPEGILISGYANETRAVGAKLSELGAARDAETQKDPNSPNIAAFDAQIAQSTKDLNAIVTKSHDAERIYFQRALGSADVAMAYANGNIKGADGKWIKIETVDNLVESVPTSLQPSVRALVMAFPEVDNRDPEKIRNFMGMLNGFVQNAPEAVSHALQANMQRFVTEAFKQIYIKDGIDPAQAEIDANEAWSMAERDGVDALSVDEQEKLKAFIQGNEWSAMRDAMVAEQNGQPAAPTEAPAAPTEPRKSGGIIGAGRAIGAGIAKGSVPAASNLVADVASGAGYVLAGKKGVPDFALLSQYRREKAALAQYTGDPAKMNTVARNQYEQARKNIAKIEEEAKKRGLSLEGKKPK
jgi:hypothetical protein